LNLPPETDGLLVYGGSFDPPHPFHVDGPRILHETLFPGWIVVYVPAGRNPLKHIGPRVSDRHRLGMLRAAIGRGGSSPRGWARVWTDELDRAAGGGPIKKENGTQVAPGPSYTVDTLRRLKKILPRPMPVRLLIGADQAERFHEWREYRSVMRMAPPLVMLREPSVEPFELIRRMRGTGVWKDPELRVWAGSIAPTPVVRAAATDVRARLTAGTAARERALGQLHQRVAAYIRRWELYRE